MGVGAWAVGAAGRICFSCSFLPQVPPTSCFPFFFSWFVFHFLFVDGCMSGWAKFRTGKASLRCFDL
jgi:hypothetical protein